MIIGAGAACRIAGVDKDRLNEAVARGDYPDAPPTTNGRERMFEDHDVVGLCVYALLLERGLPPSRAGKLAGMAMMGAKIGQDVYAFAYHDVDGRLISTTQFRLDNIRDAIALGEPLRECRI